MKKNKTLCDLSKDDIKEQLEELIQLTRQPCYICRKCARVCHTEEHLCKPVEMSS